MIIHSANFIKSSTSLEDCPGKFPEFAFIGRSNVGKSSLINMLTDRSKLAKTSGTPGKTQCINHFLINDTWYLVDLPGYGYAKVSIKMREEWNVLIKKYIRNSKHLIFLFVLIDSRIKPQASDLQFMEYLGINEIPFARVFTKTDKMGRQKLEEAIAFYNETMLKQWEAMPITFSTSTVNKQGKIEILNFIEETLNNL